jgi:hypothetical protein
MPTQKTDESIVFELGQSSNPTAIIVEEEPSNNGLSASTSNITRKQEIKRTRQTTVSIPEAKSAHLLSSLRFGCNITSNQYLSYRLLQPNQRYEELDKLDVVLAPNSSLLIHCRFLLNGLDVLEYPSNWIKDTLDKACTLYFYME